MKSHTAHVWAEDLRNEGRQLFAHYFAVQVLKDNNYGKRDLKKLLAHGAAGIDSYISLNEDELIVATEHSAVYGRYGWQVQRLNDKYNKTQKIESTTKGETK